MDCGDPVLLRKADLGRDMVMLSSLPSGWHHHHQQSLLPPSSAEEEQPQDRGGGLLWEDFSVEDLLDLGGGGGVGKEQHGAEGEGFLYTGEAEEEEEEKGGWCNSSTSSSTSALSFQAAVIPPSNSDPVVPVGSSPPSMARTSSCSAAEEKPNPCVSAGFETTQAGDVEDLEWVSRFVDDSYSEFASAALAPPFSNLHAPAPAPSAKAAAAEAEAPRARSTGSGSPLTRSWCSSCFSTGSVAVPARTRSKRSRTGGRFWSLRGPSLLSEPSSSSCSSASSSSSCSVFSSVTSSLGGGGGNPDGFPRCLGGGPFPNQSQLAQLQLTKKKKGRKPKVPPLAAAAAAAAVAGGSGGGAGQEARRRCSHCGVDKTPQWRAGPMGSKTLCNACGVRYKSGRLLPEYRPAGSPTFLSHVHSNSHRKVLEIRRSKELVAADGAAYCSSSPPQHVVEATRPYGVV